MAHDPTILPNCGTERLWLLSSIPALRRGVSRRIHPVHAVPSSAAKLH